MDLALNNLQRLICHKTKPNQTKHLQSIHNDRLFSSHCPIFPVRFQLVALNRSLHNPLDFRNRILQPDAI